MMENTKLQTLKDTQTGTKSIFGERHQGVREISVSIDILIKILLFYGFFTILQRRNISLENLNEMGSIVLDLANIHSIFEVNCFCLGLKTD